MEPVNQERNKLSRGFAVISPEKQKEITSKGGKAAQDKGVAYPWTPEQAKEGRRIGGLKRGDGRRGDDMPLL